METETENCIFRSILVVLQNVFPKPICEIFYAVGRFSLFVAKSFLFKKYLTIIVFKSVICFVSDV